jgi:phospholipid-binding lipoprotein MlaA
MNTQYNKTINTAPLRLNPLLLRGLAGSLLAGMLAGCASLPADRASAQVDPLEGYNRAMFAVNDGIDRAVLVPVAKGYTAITPDFMRTGVTNFFSNISDVVVFVNDFLQGKPGQGAQDGARFVINSTVGLFGLLDVASVADLPKHREDFGITLAVWGWENSAYLVIPLLGPYTIRDAWGEVIDTPLGLYTNLHTTNTHLAEIYAVETTSLRSNRLVASNVMETAAIDRYSFMRDAFLQRRRNMIYDGHPPVTPDDE